MSSRPEYVLRYENDEKIELFLADAPFYHNTRNYDKNLLQRSKWIEIIVHHSGKYKRRELLSSLFNTVGDEEFFPVAYNEGNISDQFLVKQNMPAVNKLFQNKLVFKIGTGIVPLTVKFNVADSTMGQISPEIRLNRAVKLLYSHLKTFDKLANILNVSNLQNNPELRDDIIIHLSNKPSFELLCRAIINNDNFYKLNGIILKHNEIKHLNPLTQFDKFNLQILDLSNNDISAFDTLKYLRNVKIKHLHLANNPISNHHNFVLKVKEILPTLLTLDGVELSKAPSNNSNTEFNAVSDVENDGSLINARAESQLELYTQSDKWHKIIVKDKGSHTKEEILQGFFAALNPVLPLVYPCYYQVEDLQDFFFVRSCYDQLKHLVANNLVIVIPENKNTLNLELRMNVSSLKSNILKPDYVVMEAADQQFNIGDKTLDLSNFCTSDKLKDVAITFAHGKFLNLILRQCSIKFLNNVAVLKLANNNIKTTIGLPYLKKMSKLKIVDLSFNKIDNLMGLTEFVCETIVELTLNGNPICKKYQHSKQYVDDLKKIFPNLVKLDGVSIQNELYMYQKNYICSAESYDFIEKFVKMFFTAYDSPLREQLAKHLYHKNAIFTISTNFDLNRISSSVKPKVLAYIKKSRNLISNKNSNVAYDLWNNIHYGNDNIEILFGTLPLTLHDLLTFSVDTLIYAKELVTITITGVFRQPAADFTDNDLLFSFSRTFVLIPVETNLRSLESGTRFQITNDQWYLTSATSSQIKDSFKYAKESESTSLVAETLEEKENFFVMFQEMTGLKSVWCSRCLEDGQWNFRRAVKAFTQMDEVNKIPNNGYTSEILIDSKS